MELIHTCYRITDPERARLLPGARAREAPRASDQGRGGELLPGRPRPTQPELELTHNFGVDSYDLGTGYGHVALTVDDLGRTLEQLAEQGIEPERPPYRVREGGSRLCFVRDPDS